MSEKKKFYITTAIAYASSKPHIGNAYDIVLADMIARYKKMMGFDVFLMTGSDEHGQKIEERAKAAGITPKEYVDNAASVIKGVWDSLNTDYDKFIRTTDDYHEATVQKIFKKLYEQGDIYKSEYQGKYCVPCESFYTESQLVDGKCPDCGREVIDSKEEAYFLKLSKYQDKLLKYFEENPDFIKPESRKNEMINNFLKPGLSDLCVSRSSFKWGVPVSFDDKHVIYVWIDALSNYITGIGYNTEENSEQYKKLWPADLHVIGKDIVRFHTIYWPIILMALGEPLPKQVLGHPWVLVGEDKMSKSKGNVVYADELAKRFSIDAVRYYLLSEIPFAQDGTFTYESFINKFNTDLANTLGNLVNRSIAMTNKYFGGKVSKGEIAEECDKELLQTAKDSIAKYYGLMDSYHNAEACEAVMNLAKRCNKYIDETTPWALAKDEANSERLSSVLYNLLECIRLLGIMLTPIIPESCESIKEQLGTENTELEFGVVKDYYVGEAKPLFARLDAQKVLEEIAAEQEAKEKAAAKAENVATIAQIGIEDFAKVELKAAKIVACEPVPKAKKLLKLTLNDGSGTPRIVASGIAKWYKPEDLIGHTVIVVSNLKPAVLCGVESNGMILAADCAEDDVKVLFIDNVPEGSKIR
ncbi:MAG: methionine--tRNA ligase [Ruminococcaceae bacterium]|nr:methionine--tRNA ligase [Oscillospiraceae bacterium]